MATIEQFHRWVERDLARFGKSREDIMIQYGTLSDCRNGVTASNIRIFTDNNEYRISVNTGTLREGAGLRERMRARKGYLGCVASSRKPRAGETHHRGNDLPDGPLTEETWHSILAAIVAYELVKVHRPAPLVSRSFDAAVGVGVGHGDMCGGSLDQRYVNKP